MYYCKDLISRSVLSLYEGELIGSVDKLHFDKKLKKLKAVEVVSAEGIKMLLPTKNIYNVGKNAITVKNNQALTLKKECEDSCLAPIGSKAYSIAGEFLGVVQEIVISHKFETDKISLDSDVVLSVDNLASCGKNTIIFHEDNKKINMRNFMPNKQPKDFKDETVQSSSVMPVQDRSAEVVLVEDKKIVQSSEYLIGRICLKEIVNFNNEVLIKPNEKVTKKNLKEINRFGKIRELMLYLK